MFVSFLIPSIFEGVRARHLNVFYKQLADFGRDGIAFVGEADYFRAPADWSAEGRGEFTESWQRSHEYETPANLDGVTFVELPADLFAARLKRLGSSWKVFGQLCRRRLPELEAAFDHAIATLGGARRIDAIITFAHVPSVAVVAGRLGIPVINCEYGPIRKPGYVMTGYWDARTGSAAQDTARRLERFRAELLKTPYPMLEREEINHTLRVSPPIDWVPPSDADFRIGIALQYHDNAYAHGIAPLDLHSYARRNVANSEILIRPHPFSTWCEPLAEIDRSATATEFVMRCESILSVNSGTAFEALLLGRRCTVVGDSPFRIASTSLPASRSNADAQGQLEMLNFLAFGCIVPLPFMFNRDYISWRLTGPSELEILKRHQRWYREALVSRSRTAAVELDISTSLKLVSSLRHEGTHSALAVFGGGDWTASLVSELATQFNVSTIFDNDQAKWGRLVAGVRIQAPGLEAGTRVLVASLTHADAMAAQLRALGYSEERIVRLR